RIGRRASNAVPMIVPLMNSTNDDVCASAAHALWWITGDRAAAVQSLEAQVAKLDFVFISSYQPRPLKYLLEIDPRSAAIIEYFRRGLHSKHRPIQINACQHL